MLGSFWRYKWSTISCISFRLLFSDLLEINKTCEIKKRYNFTVQKMLQTDYSWQSSAEFPKALLGHIDKHA